MLKLNFIKKILKEVGFSLETIAIIMISIITLTININGIELDLNFSSLEEVSNKDTVFLHTYLLLVWIIGFILFLIMWQKAFGKL